MVVYIRSLNVHREDRVIRVGLIGGEGVTLTTLRESQGGLKGTQIRA